jgi:hypothetical protein
MASVFTSSERTLDVLILVIVIAISLSTQKENFLLRPVGGERVSYKKVLLDRHSNGHSPVTAAFCCNPPCSESSKFLDIFISLALYEQNSLPA